MVPRRRSGVFMVSTLRTVREFSLPVTYVLAPDLPGQEDGREDGLRGEE